jgi:hypothetical protein
MKRLIEVGLGLALATAGLAQVDQPAQRGIVPSSVYSVSDIDSVDLKSGNLSLQIPLAALPPGPGGSGAHVGLNYNSQIYDWQAQTGATTGMFRPSTTGGGWRYNFQYSYGEEQRPYNSDTAQPDCTTWDLEHQERSEAST